MRIGNDSKGNTDGTCTLTMEEVGIILDTLQWMDILQPDLKHDGADDLTSQFNAFYELMEKHS